MSPTMSLWIAFTVLASVIVGILVWKFRIFSKDPAESLRQLGHFLKNQERLERLLKEEFALNRQEATSNERNSREEIQRQLFHLLQTNEQKLEKMRETIEGRLKFLQDENSQKLEQMRLVVDEKLQATLEKRLSDSFRMVSERLEQVHKGLGEMQSLAADVGALQRTLTNVKTRGTWGEVQLESLLQQVLSPEQYAKNIATKKGSEDRVEFAIRLPGKGSWNETEIWLPIDAKFPQEDYQRLTQALEKGDGEAAEEASKSLIQRIKTEARNIRDKYLDPPSTTDFGILFLSTEGLYAEVLRQPGLLDVLQREFRIVITGPTTLAAILNSLQIGFRTLAIEKRTSEVWALLGSVKKEFGLFAEVLEKTQKKLQEASHTIEKAAVKTRSIERKLKNVEGLPVSEDLSLVGEPEKEPGEEG